METTETYQTPNTAAAPAGANSGSLPAFTPAADTYAVVEVFGHRSHVGRIREVTVAGVTMLLIETPELAEEGERTEREDTRTHREYNYDTGRHDVYEQTGRWVREPAPAVPSEQHYYAGSAIFSLTPITQEEAFRRVRRENPGRQEMWVPDGPPKPVVKALPSGDTAGTTSGNDTDDKDADVEGIFAPVDEENEDDGDPIARAFGPFGGPRRRAL